MFVSWRSRYSILYYLARLAENPELYTRFILVDIVFMIAMICFTVCMGIIKKQSWKYYFFCALIIVIDVFVGWTFSVIIFTALQTVFFAPKRKPWTCAKCGTVNDVNLARCTKCNNSRFFNKGGEEKDEKEDGRR